MSRTAAKRPSTGTPPAPAPRGALWATLALGVAGVALALALTKLHADAHAGVRSFCAISDVVNCDRVATSPYAVLLGLPVSVWGLLGFGLVAALAASGLAARRPHAGWPAGLLVLLGAFATAVSIALALVSKLAIGAWCILCAAGWLVSAGILAAAWAAARPSGLATALRADAGAVRARAGRAAAFAVAGAVAIALAALAYPRYWERRAAAAPAAQGDAPGAPAPVDPGPGVVVEYSDYLCPFCARLYAQAEAAHAARPGVRIVRRHFPLEPACNAAVKRAIHPGACDAARAAVCAEAQGRGDEMDGALFGNQAERAPIDALARRIGLDLARFRACLSAPATDARIAEDVAAGVRDGVRATPTYVSGARRYEGTLPPELAPPASSPPSPPR